MYSSTSFSARRVWITVLSQVEWCLSYFSMGWSFSVMLLFSVSSQDAQSGQWSWQGCYFLSWGLIPTPLPSLFPPFNASKFFSCLLPLLLRALWLQATNTSSDQFTIKRNFLKGETKTHNQREGSVRLGADKNHAASGDLGGRNVCTQKCLAQTELSS